jgi:hypothetical protein
VSRLKSDITLTDKINPEVIGKLDGIAQTHHRLGHLLRSGDRRDRQDEGTDEPNTHMTF